MARCCQAENVSCKTSGRNFLLFRRVEVADFEIYSCTPATDSSAVLDTSIRYEIVGAGNNDTREQRIGSWEILWLRDDSGHWKATQWTAYQQYVTVRVTT